MSTQRRAESQAGEYRSFLPASPCVVVTLISLLLLSACTRERLSEGVNSSLGQQGQEPLVMQPDTPAPTATLTPVPTPEETPVPKVIAYEVGPGDTIIAIAEKFGTTSDRLRALNLLSTDTLQVGQVLRVPYEHGLTTPSGLPTATPSPFEYTVQRGDTLLSIALRFEVSLNELKEINTVQDEHSLFVGQVLVIPGGVSSDRSNAGGGGAAVDPVLARTPGRHTVRAGETLAQIADQYGVSLPELIAYNSNTITNPHVLKPKTVLVIPGMTAAQVRSISLVRYTVQAGDSLLGIAQQFGVSVEALMASNNISDADLVRVGDELVIPEAED